MNPDTRKFLTGLAEWVVGVIVGLVLIQLA
jgi:hypothetical protein